MEISNNEISQFLDVVKRNSDYDFSDYSTNSLRRRLIKIGNDYGENFQRLLRTIDSDQIALEEIIKKITVNTTELFRDTNIWKSLLYNLLPKFKNPEVLNIWHAGCSTGEEVYSMMILLDQLDMLDKARIFATDINTDVMEIAKKGSYRLRFNREYIDNFNTVFEKDPDKENDKTFKPISRYLVINEVRDKINMADFLTKKPEYHKIDLVKGEKLYRESFDLIICRNVIIYFNYELQNKVLSYFHRNLKNNGYLVLGIHESIIGPGMHLFEKDDPYYKKKPVNSSTSYL